MQNHNLLCYFVMHSPSSQCLMNRHLGWRSNIPQLVAWHFVSQKLQTCCLTAWCRTVDPVSFTLSKKLLWGQMPERLGYCLDSCHGNRGAWQLMFHPQINYSMLLIEENAYFFFLLFLSSPPWITFWRICVTVAPFFPVLCALNTRNGSLFSMSL